ncbi:hypothetical protein IT397_00780 [Candidatus Nomurabacteria bacterium]|nr:hypothetical protein [Candidatus Nomurabacteria bacterium]
MKKITLALLILMVLLAIFLIIKSEKLAKNTKSIQAENTGGAQGQFAKLASDALVIHEQVAGDMTAVVDAVNVSNNGFVVIKSDENIIGISKFLTAGNYSKLEISLTEKLKDSAMYIGEVYMDDGDKIFDPEKDNVFVSKINNENLRMEFKASRDAKNPREIQIYY